MNVRKLMARLNTPTANLSGGGRGGAPQLTPQDISGALGFVRHDHPLGAEVFARAWWPDGAMLDGGSALRRRFSELLIAEIDRRSAQLHEAKMSLLRAESTRNQAMADRTLTRDQAHDVERWKAVVNHAQQAVWPSDTSIVDKILEAALAEVCNPNTCATCEGSGESRIEGKVVTCPDCRGHCIVPVTDSMRARRIGRNSKTYTTGFWRPMYEFTYAALRDAEQEACTAMEKQLSRKPTSKAA